VIERACLMTDGRMLCERELAAAMSAGMGGAARAVVHSRPRAAPRPASSRLSTAQRDQIERVLTAVGGNKTAAAHELGISRRSLYRGSIDSTSNNLPFVAGSDRARRSFECAVNGTHSIMTASQICCTSPFFVGIVAAALQRGSKSIMSCKSYTSQ
jgi:hypothetical protein